MANIVGREKGGVTESMTEGVFPGTNIPISSRVEKQAFKSHNPSATAIITDFLKGKFPIFSSINGVEGTDALESAFLSKGIRINVVHALKAWNQLHSTQAQLNNVHETTAWKGEGISFVVCKKTVKPKIRELMQMKDSILTPSPAPPPPLASR